MTIEQSNEIAEKLHNQILKTIDDFLRDEDKNKNMNSIEVMFLALSRVTFVLLVMKDKKGKYEEKIRELIFKHMVEINKMLVQIQFK